MALKTENFFSNWHLEVKVKGTLSLEQITNKATDESKYLRMDQVKFVEDSL